MYLFIYLYFFILILSRFAYIEFVDKSSVPQAIDLDDSLFKGRQIKVIIKRIIIVKKNFF